MSAFDLVLKPSARAHHLLFWTHALALVLLPLSMEPGPFMVLTAFGVALSWLWLRRHAAFGYGPRALLRVQSDPQGQWTVQPRSGGAQVAQLSGSSVVSSAMIVLDFRTAQGRRFTRVLLGDETTPEALRRLRARLSSETPPPEPPNKSA